ncbi:FUSC family protein [Phyllobacterium phragmitis]|uniref:FUSC family protein n=1 Tax=Phyllobacterium phragmitis TaxID=2670329 RepID=A0A2S9ITL6_9HYPH|nr:FUSC family protein [Phyllobacterium phragmitis]PRD43866.1 FUSC family protein [Phyllobacterium phragmitis]
MTAHRLDRIKKALVYASKMFLGAAICWYGLLLMGVSNPIWAVITVLIVSDPDVTTAFNLAKTRTLNTAVGCTVGLTTMLIFGYSPEASVFMMALTVFVIMLIDHYPANWRLAPATVFIVMDAGRLAATQREEITYAMLRMLEIAVGCAVALALAGLYTYLAERQPRETDVT